MRPLMPLLAAAASMLTTNAAYADLGDQLFKLLPNDGAEGDVFGLSIAISGTTAIVGAHLDDDNGDASGSAYLFDTVTDRQIAKLLPDDGAAGNVFGRRVAISGTTAIVAAPLDDDNGFYSGSAYLFDTTTGRQLFKLLPNDGAPEDQFGVSVAISGTTAIVGAWWDDDNGTDSGSTYLFDTTTGGQIAKLLPQDGAVSDIFGSGVAISGDIAIVGAPLDDNDNGAHSGAAYLFDIRTGRQIAKLLANDGAAHDLFGASIAIAGPPGNEVAIIAAMLDDDNGESSGSAYLFDISNPKAPVQIAKLLPEDGAMDDWFGRSVAIGGPSGNEVAIVGAQRDDDNGSSSGAAYLFNTTTGQQVSKLLPGDGAPEDYFGYSVAISPDEIGTIAIVGAPGHDDNGADSGSAYVFDAAAPGMCPWDLDANGSVGASDLLALLASWGPCKGCPADFDGNGTVGASDLLALLANWGPCP